MQQDPTKHLSNLWVSKTMSKLTNYRSEHSVITDIFSGEQKQDEETSEKLNIDEEDIKLSPKLVQLLRMGLADKGELETMKRALKSGDKALTNPLLREKLFELLNKLVEAIEEDKQIWVRLRKRLLDKGEDDNE